MTKATYLSLPDGAYLALLRHRGGGRRAQVFWHHGSPNTAEPPEPLWPAAAERNIRWIS